MLPSRMQQVLQAQAAAEGELLAKQNVIGVAVGFKESEGVVTDQLALIALVKAKKPLSELSNTDLVPQTVDGVRTDVYVVGDLRAQGVAGDPRTRYRPNIPSGVSIGHTGITAGTLGTVVRDRQTGELLLLSNNHVFADSNDGRQGDAILQPAPLDGGSQPSDIVAKLDRFVPLRFVEDANRPDQPGPTPIPTDPNAPGCLGFFVAITNLIAGLTGSQQRITVTDSGAPASAYSAQAEGQLSNPPTITAGTGKAMTATQALTPDNAVDAALAKPIPGSNITFDTNILNIGPVSGTKTPVLGATVRKSGRTTGLRQGRITLLNATVNITYDTNRGARTARFTGQAICEPISEGGDSGSLVVDGTENKAVGLLFAGSPVATIFTPIDTVLAALDVMI